MNFRYMPIEDVIAQLRKAGSIWFRNDDLLLLEELIRRVYILLQTKEKISE